MVTAARDLSNKAENRPSQLRIRITDIQVAVIKGNFPWVICQVGTDKGVVGLGESNWSPGIVELIKGMKSFLIGENPMDTSRLYELMVQNMYGNGSMGGATLHAISGIETALWDIAGKVLDAPVYQLLGGSIGTKLGSIVIAILEKPQTTKLAQIRQLK